MAVRIMVRKLSSKCAIDTPTTFLAGDMELLQAGLAISVPATTTTPITGTIKRDTVPPSRMRAAMAITIGNDRGHDDAALDDVLDVGVEANEREPARHDAEDHRTDDGAADPADAA